MLPDYSRAKEQLRTTLLKVLQKRIQYYEGDLALSESRAFEGRSFATKTEDGTVLDSEAKELSGKIEFRKEDIQSGDPRLIFARLDEIARQIAHSKQKALFEQVDKTCKATGQVFDGGGKPLTAEMLFQVLEGTLIEFDADGKHNDLMIVIGPELTQRAKEVLQELQSDPRLKKKHDELMERKRMQWRDREATRKLVG